jgi:hypothetical protein
VAENNGRHDQHVVVNLIIVGTPETALIEARKRLNDLLNQWFTEDMNSKAPFPEGSLLTWNITFKDRL